MFGVGIGAGADEVALLDEGGDVGGGAVVALDEGGVGPAGLGVGEEDAAAQRWMAGEIDRADGTLVQQEDDLAACVDEGGPIVGEDGFVKGVIVAADVVGGDALVGGEDGANLGVEGVEGGGGEGLGDGEVQIALGGALLGLDQDEDGDVVGMGMGPVADLLEAGDEGLAGAAVVDVLYVHDLEAGLAHDAIGIEVGIGRKAGGGSHRGAGGMGVETSLGVGVDVELNLANAAVELLGERLVFVIEAFEGLGVLGLPELALVGSDAGVIAVVSPDDLDLVELEVAVVGGGLSLRVCEETGAGRGECEGEECADGLTEHVDGLPCRS